MICKQHHSYKQHLHIVWELSKPLSHAAWHHTRLCKQSSSFVPTLLHTSPFVSILGEIWSKVYPLTSKVVSDDELCLILHAQLLLELNFISSLATFTGATLSMINDMIYNLNIIYNWLQVTFIRINIAF